ncbi:MAG: NADH-quinone oxidoreductase subunit C [Acidimicrobiales bacterium]|nr:NADH-quinone oxidoreductase subunit C [Acidimicrobiales bacterium]
MADEIQATGTEQSTGEETPFSSPGPQPETMYGVPVTYSRGQRVLHPSRDQLVEVVRLLHGDGYLLCLDVTAVDYLVYEADRQLPEGIEAERFEVVVTLLSFKAAERIRLRVQIPEDDPLCPTLTVVHPGADAFEREVFDMFGIEFVGHPDLTRILMPEDWSGHPLRKDYNSGRIPVQFKAAPSNR